MQYTESRRVHKAQVNRILCLGSYFKVLIWFRPTKQKYELCAVNLTQRVKQILALLSLQ
jgi:hypothetical protein